MKNRSLTVHSLKHAFIRIMRIAPLLNAQSGTIGQRMVRSSFWSFVSYGSGRFLGVIRSIILARLLLPKDFGIVGLAEVATGFLAILMEFGIDQALIYKQDITKEGLNTAWTLALIRGVFLGILTYLVAGLVGKFYNTPELITVLKVMALLFIVTGLNSTGPILLTKEMDFKTLAIFSLISNILSLLITVLLAISFKNYWALVIGSFVQALIVLAGSYIIHPFRPRLYWQPAVARELLHFGKYIFGGGIVNYFLTQGDNALVGKVLGTEPLGFYRMAYNISNLPGTSINSIIGQVAYPAYAKLQHDTVALRKAYLKVLKFTCIFAVPVCIGMMVLGSELVRVIFSERWVPMIPSFIVLSIYGLERSMNASVAPLLKAIGKPQIPFYLTLIKLILLAAIIYPFTIKYGILGTSIASSIVAVIISLNTLIPVSRALSCKISDLLKPLLGTFTASGIMALLLLLLKLNGWLPASLLPVIGAIFLGAVVYFLSLAIIDKSIIKDIRALIQSQTPQVETI